MEKGSTDSSSWHVTAKHGYYSNGIVGRKAAITEEVFKKKKPISPCKIHEKRSFQRSYSSPPLHERSRREPYQETFKN